MFGEVMGPGNAGPGSVIPPLLRVDACEKAAKENSKMAVKTANSVLREEENIDS